MSVMAKAPQELPHTLGDGLVLRRANEDDVPRLQELIAASARELCAPDYTSTQIERALGGAWAVDPQLIADGTYFVVERRAEADDSGELVACGGWSARSTLFGGETVTSGVRDDRWLDPATDAARMRAYFVSPNVSRRGLGRLLLETSERAAEAAGFARTALVATLTGVRLYERFHYVAMEPIDFPLGRDGATIRFVLMEKDLPSGSIGGAGEC